jgi:hypothetical protein
MKEVAAMDEQDRDTIVFEAGDGTAMEFTVMHEFYFDGGMYAVLQSAANAQDTLIAEIADPLGPDEEFLPLPLQRQQELLDYLGRDGITE